MKPAQQVFPFVHFSLFDRAEIGTRAKIEEKMEGERRRSSFLFLPLPLPIFSLALFRAHPKDGKVFLEQKTPWKRLLCRLGLDETGDCLILASVLQRAHISIQWINRYPADKNVLQLVHFTRWKAGHIFELIFQKVATEIDVFVTFS